ncbi:MAG: YkvA family protein [Xanthobacteraceae bacterium]|nr:YkvA family protein [Xanthobacteraceae bacterium]
MASEQARAEAGFGQAEHAARDEAPRDDEGLAREQARVRREFWPKVKKVAASLPFAADLLAAYYCAFDRHTPRHVQAALIGALAYFILPFDAIPDMLPVLGFTDDAAILATAIKLVSSHVRPDHRAAASAALARLRGEGQSVL